MAYTPVPTATTGDTFSAAYWNQYVRDNFAAGIPDLFAAKGDLAGATGADAAVKFTVGADGLALIADSSQASGMAWGYASTWRPITTTRLGVDTATVTFSSIPATYNHLRVLISGMTGFTGTPSSYRIYLQINGDAGNNYDDALPVLDTISFSASDGLAGASIPLGFLPTSYNSNARAGLIDLLLPDYAGSTFQKAVMATSQWQAVNTDFSSGWWRNTAAINALAFSVQASQNFLAGTILSLYGL